MHRLGRDLALSIFCPFSSQAYVWHLCSPLSVSLAMLSVSSVSTLTTMSCAAMSTSTSFSSGVSGVSGACEVLSMSSVKLAVFFVWLSTSSLMRARYRRRESWP